MAKSPVNAPLNSHIWPCMTMQPNCMDGRKGRNKSEQNPDSIGRARQPLRKTFAHFIRLKIRHFRDLDFNVFSATYPLTWTKDTAKLSMFMRPFPRWSGVIQSSRRFLYGTCLLDFCCKHGVSRVGRTRRVGIHFWDFH